jgi:hypothetical protein
MGQRSSLVCDLAGDGLSSRSRTERTPDRGTGSTGGDYPGGRYPAMETMAITRQETPYTQTFAGVEGEKPALRLTWWPVCKPWQDTPNHHPSHLPNQLPNRLPSQLPSQLPTTAYTGPQDRPEGRWQGQQVRYAIFSQEGCENAS